MTLGIGIVGCGNVAPRYVARLRTMPGAVLVGAADIEAHRARDLASSFSGRPYRSVADLLNDDRVGVVVNLTPPSRHAEVTEKALRAGRHVYSEKPLALEPGEAWHLVKLAQRYRLQLGCAPATVLAPAQCDVVELVLSGRLGQVRVAYAEADWGRIDLSHPASRPLLDVGPMADVGVYPLALMVAALGRVTSVRAFGATLRPGHESEDFIVVAMTHRSGAVSRLTSSFYVQHRAGSSSVMFHGDEGSAWLASWHDDQAEVRVAPRDRPYAIERPAERRKSSVDWGRGVEDLLGAIRDGRPPRADGTRAAHLVEVLDAAKASIASGGAERPVAHPKLVVEPAVRLELER